MTVGYTNDYSILKIVPNKVDCIVAMSDLNMIWQHFIVLA